MCACSGNQANTKDVQQVSKEVPKRETSIGGAVVGNGVGAKFSREFASVCGLKAQEAEEALAFEIGTALSEPEASIINKDFERAESIISHKYYGLLNDSRWILDREEERIKREAKLLMFLGIVHYEKDKDNELLEKCLRGALCLYQHVEIHPAIRNPALLEIHKVTREKVVGNPEICENKI